VAVGAAAGEDLSSGTLNVFVGRQAGQHVTTASYNTFVGSGTDGAGSNFGAGEEVTSGAKNTILGGYNGNQDGLDIRTADNNIVLSDGDGNPRMIYGAANATWAAFTASGIGRINSPGGVGIPEITVADDSTVTLTGSTAGAMAVLVYETGNGDGALFFGTYRQTTTLVASGTTAGFSTSDEDNKLCVFKSSNSHTITFKNRVGSTKNFYFLILGAQAR
jgi:hypothetical protein